jgi:hypothetical protein
MAASLAGSSHAVMFVVVRHQRDSCLVIPLNSNHANQAYVLSTRHGIDLQVWQNLLPLPPHHSNPYIPYLQSRTRGVALNCTMAEMLSVFTSIFRVKTFETRFTVYDSMKRYISTSRPLPY